MCSGCRERYPLGAGPRCYFKIGIYRDPIADVATLYVANFRRGRSFAEVDPAAVAREL